MGVTVIGMPKENYVGFHGLNNIHFLLLAVVVVVVVVVGLSWKNPTEEMMLGVVPWW